VPPADVLVLPAVIAGVVELNLMGDTFLLGAGEVVVVVLFGAGLLLC